MPFYLFYQMGSFGKIMLWAFNFISLVQVQTWPEPTQLQWNRLNRHQIIVKFLKLLKIHLTDKTLSQVLINIQSCVHS
jgi:hypothetical protein